MFLSLRQVGLGAALCCLTLAALEAALPGEGEENTVASATEKAVSLHTVTGLIYQMREAQAEGMDLEAAFKPADHSSYGPYPKIVQWCLKDSKEAVGSSSASFFDLMGSRPDNARHLMVERAGQNKAYAEPDARCDADIRAAFLQQTYDQISQPTQWNAHWAGALTDAYVKNKASQNPNIPLNELLSSDESQRLRHQLKTSTCLRQKAEEAAGSWLNANPEEALAAWKDTLLRSPEFRHTRPACERTRGPRDTFNVTPRPTSSSLWSGLSAYIPSAETTNTALRWGIPPVVMGIGYLLYTDGTAPLIGDACIAPPQEKFLDLLEKTCKDNTF